MPASPSPTPAQSLEGVKSTSCNVAPAMAELLRRFRADLSPLFQYANANGYSVEDIATNTKAIGLTGSMPSGNVANTILLAIQSTCLPEGISGLFKTENDLLVFSLGQRMEIDSQGLSAWARGALIVGYLHAYLGGCCDLSGASVWQQLVYVGMEVLPEGWEEYSGCMLRFGMLLTPNP